MEFGDGTYRGIKACFIGYAEVDPVRKLHAIRKHASEVADWTEELDDASLLNLIGELRAFSEYLRRECSHYKIPYFDGSTYFASAIREAKTYLQSAMVPSSIALFSSHSPPRASTRPACG